MGHAKVDTTLNVYTQVIDGAKLAAAQAVGSGLIEIERNAEGPTTLIHCADWLAALDDFRNWLICEAA